MLRPFPGRVRSDADLRRLPVGRDPHDAAADLPRAGVRSPSRHWAVPPAHRHRRGHHRHRLPIAPCSPPAPAPCPRRPLLPRSHPAEAAPVGHPGAAGLPVAAGGGVPATDAAGPPVADGAGQAGDSSAPTPSLAAAAQIVERGVAIDFTTPAEGTTAIIGRNGAGKSSLFQVLTGALRADAGALRIGTDTIFDLDAGHWPPVHARGIVHLAQNPLLFPHLSVIDNVCFGLRARGTPAAQARRQAQVMLDRLGVGHCANRRPEAVSGGQAARIALARALVVDPKLLLLDEPLAALDVDVRIETRQVLAELLAGRTAMLITHDVDDVAALAQTLVLVEDGAVVHSARVGAVDPDHAGTGREFLRSFCMSDGDGIVCNQSHS
ncbi:ATP-binding cassette domain-containing protein [Brevibacterium sp. SMBL_HHYL_HB1]|uniref:ATP-binding cassette domain-containing protein n=1 Tax=Brevibacterium sp. SMBL_HHYL_HB1 TaxID=2777556 RepID=UPI002011257B|nr:ATP-binding cassette domain-containing protein [Brevibacterium sp. SMBL_HHYL_HB1]